MRYKVVIIAYFRKSLFSLFCPTIAVKLAICTYYLDFRKILYSQEEVFYG